MEAGEELREGRVSGRVGGREGGRQHAFRQLRVQTAARSDDTRIHSPGAEASTVDALLHRQPLLPPVGELAEALAVVALAS